jgi:alanyl-tRNA synthetase
VCWNFKRQFSEAFAPRGAAACVETDFAVKTPKEFEQDLMNSFEISDRFVRYYQNRGFELLPSASLLDPSIPMTFVMSAGLVQVEMSLDQLGHSDDGDFYVLRQNCFRHFDLDSVGKSNVHLSLFEMPGAFTFGLNDKAMAVQQVWDLVTKTLEIDPARLWVTYFGGGTKGGHQFPPDVETYQAWRQIGLPEERIVALGPNDNFWMQGGGIDGHEPSRKCGPNTEVFFDRGEDLRCSAECRPGCRCGRFVEFANSLFIFAEVDEETGALRPMDRPFDETVIGTERVAMISQGKASVFEIDCIRPLVDKVRFFCSGSDADDWTDRAVQIISDYVRALLFLIADGAPPPGKGGRQRIVKLLIRGVVTQQRILGISSSSFLPELIDTIITTYGEQYPKLADGRQLLLDYFAGERMRFEKTLQKGYRRLDRLVETSKRAPSGEQMVDLVKKHGFPLPLIKAALHQRGFDFEDQAYHNALMKWRESHIS